MPAPSIDFWFEFASTYSYPAAMRVLRGVGADPDAAFAAANIAENKERLKTQTADAVARGIFGAPSFTVGDELFWGNDRLEEAVEWAARR